MISNSDLDVLTSVLQLILRPAQQYSAQPSVAQALRITPAKFQALARHWPVYSEHGLSLADLASGGADEIAAVESLSPECSDLTFTFYRRETSSMDALQATGPTTIHLSALSQSQQEPFDILVSTVQTYQVPPDDHVELLSRIRAHWIMGKGRSEQRSKLTVIRLLSLAIFCHTHQEQEAQTSILMYEPDIVGHISSLLQLGKDIPPPVRTAALAALDALSRYRGRTQDVLSGVNAGVNHGLLMTLLRRTIHDMADPSNDIPQSFIEALLSFISFLATHTAGGNMLIGAGIIPLLIEVTKNQLPRCLAIVSKTMTLIDNILYGYQNAFQVFVGAGGVNVMVDRVKVCAERPGAIND
jgi:E3 ubiquitin-protein ligase HUWE1